MKRRTERFPAAILTADLVVCGRPLRQDEAGTSARISTRYRKIRREGQPLPAAELERG
jgi:hypothetical protein